MVMNELLFDELNAMVILAKISLVMMITRDPGGCRYDAESLDSMVRSTETQP